MRYPIAIEPGDEAQAFGVVVPDLPGCFSAGDTLDEALSNAEEAVVAWIDAMLIVRRRFRSLQASTRCAWPIPGSRAGCGPS